MSLLQYEAVGSRWRGVLSIIDVYSMFDAAASLGQGLLSQATSSSATQASKQVAQAETP